MGALAAGCTLTWSSPTLIKLQSGDPSIGMRITDDESSWVGSLVTLGAAVGPLLAGALLDKLGRKNTILLSMVLSAISWIIVAAVPGLYSLFGVWILFGYTVGVPGLLALYGARVLAGIAVGVIFTAVPMYIVEIAEVRKYINNNKKKNPQYFGKNKTKIEYNYLVNLKVMEYKWPQ